MLYTFFSLLLIAVLGTVVRTMEVSQTPLELYVEWHGTQFTDAQGQTIYKVKPLPKVPIFTKDFDIMNAKNQIVARVREKHLAITDEWDIEYYDEVKGQWSTCNIQFSFLRYRSKINANGRNFKIQGDFRRMQYDIVGAQDSVTYAESELQSKMRMGHGMTEDLYKLTVLHPKLPAPLVVALHRIRYLGNFVAAVMEFVVVMSGTAILISLLLLLEPFNH